MATTFDCLVYDPREGKRYNSQTGPRWARSPSFKTRRPSRKRSWRICEPTRWRCSQNGWQATLNDFNASLYKHLHLSLADEKHVGWMAQWETVRLRMSSGSSPSIRSPESHGHSTPEPAQH